MICHASLHARRHFERRVLAPEIVVHERDCQLLAEAVQRPCPSVNPSRKPPPDARNWPAWSASHFTDNDGRSILRIFRSTFFV